MSSAEQPDAGASSGPPPRLNAVTTSPGLRDAPGSPLRIDPQRPPRAGQPGHGRAASLRRQPAWVVYDREGQRTGLFEIICRDCGDHPYLDYEAISPRLQRIRGPYTLAAGVDAYAEHVGLSEATPGRPGDSWLPTDAGSAVTLPPPGQPGHCWTARLRHQPCHFVDGRAEGGYTDAFEIICPSCGDDPDLDYSEVPPWLQHLRGPRTIKEGLAVYLEHIGG